MSPRWLRLATSSNTGAAAPHGMTEERRRYFEPHRPRSSAGPAPRASLFTGPRGETIQTKLAIGHASDPLEREADRAAEQVLSSDGRAAPPGLAAVPALRRKCDACEKEDDDERLLRREIPGSAEPEAAPPIVGEVLQSGGQPLDPARRAFFEPRFGFDFSQVRIHADARAAESARAVNALAYTAGRDVVFGAGRYAPGTPAGASLLAHELAHVVQQSASPRAAEQVLRREPVPQPPLKIPGSADLELPTRIIEFSAAETPGDKDARLIDLAAQLQALPGVNPATLELSSAYIEISGSVSFGIGGMNETPALNARLFAIKGALLRLGVAANKVQIISPLTSTEESGKVWLRLFKRSRGLAHFDPILPASATRGGEAQIDVLKQRGTPVAAPTSSGLPDINIDLKFKIVDKKKSDEPGAPSTALVTVEPFELNAALPMITGAPHVVGLKFTAKAPATFAFALTVDDGKPISVSLTSELDADPDAKKLSAGLSVKVSDGSCAIPLPADKINNVVNAAKKLQDALKPAPESDPITKATQKAQADADAKLKGAQPPTKPDPPPTGVSKLTKPIEDIVSPIKSQVTSTFVTDRNKAIIGAVVALGSAISDITKARNDPGPCKTPKARVELGIKLETRYGPPDSAKPNTPDVVMDRATKALFYVNIAW